MVVDQGHGAVLHFGTAEGFGLDRRGFLEFQGGFLGDGKARAPADHHQPLAIAQDIDSQAPVLGCRFAQPLGQG
ncbi:hypothetical protein D3C80_1775910 [compost metagenome]